MNDKEPRFLRALKRKPVDSTPVWMMRQAGRYLPEYREVRKNAKDFIQMCKTPELAATVTLQPLQRFDLDASIIFSDILVIPQAMGVDLKFVENQGPVLSTISTQNQINTLKTINAEEDLGYVLDAIKLVKKDLPSSIPLIGFCGSPWTVACYMVEGQTSKTFSKIKKWAYVDPNGIKSLLQKLTDASIGYLKAQVTAGAQVLQIFDTWGGVLPPKEYSEFSLSFMQQIVASLKQDPTLKDIPIILFSKGANFALEEIANTGCDAVSLDWTQDLKQAKNLVGSKVALQGNLDPCCLYASKETIQNKVTSILAAYNSEPGHIFNLGHGIYPDIPIEGVEYMIEAIRGRV
jgi:uroporphyrinogen decarboxylase